jgi:hypothetical protein
VGLERTTRLLRGIAAGVIAFVLLRAPLDAALGRVPESLRPWAGWLLFGIILLAWGVLIWRRRRQVR